MYAYIVSMDGLGLYENIHFIGIGGISMKALARYCKMLGKNISGSDDNKGDIINQLANEGIKIYPSDSIDFLDNCSCVVYTAAIPQNNPQLMHAKALRIPVMERKVLLGLISKRFKKCISVAGTHGKTTCTAMICKIFKSANLQFTGHIGGDIPDEESNLISKGKDYFVTEACEYNRSFLSLSSDVALILNMSYDHPDCYADMDDMVSAYNSFVGNCKRGGSVIVYSDVKDRIKCNNKIITFGYGKDCDYYPEKITYKDGRYSFYISKQGGRLAYIDLSVCGKHNVLNALAAFACATECGIDALTASQGLNMFSGVKARFEHVGTTAGGAKVIYDYAHHPDEIAATIDTARVLSKGRVIAVFEPHTFSRTKSLMSQFCACFSMADEIIILPTYKARENYIEGGAAYDMYVALSKRGCKVKYACDYKKAAQLLEAADNSDVILIMGAGSVSALSKEIVS